LIFVPVYLLLMHFWKAIDEEDKNFVKKVLGGRWSAVSEKLTAKKKTADHRPLTTDH